MTATAILPLSLAPPSLLVCVNQSSRSCDELRRAGTLGVGILRSTQLDVARRYAKGGGDKTLPPALTRPLPAEGVDAAPALSDALAQFQCRVVSSHDAFTHTIFVVEVLDVDFGSDGSPLLHHLGGFAAVGDPLV
jgi:flavin reductase